MFLSKLSSISLNCQLLGTCVSAALPLSPDVLHVISSHEPLQLTLTNAIYHHFEGTTVLHTSVAHFRWFSVDFRHTAQNYRKNPHPENSQVPSVLGKRSHT
jgi:hypothetical protein